MTEILPLGTIIVEYVPYARQTFQTFFTGKTSWPESCAGYLVDARIFSELQRPDYRWLTDVLPASQVPRRRRAFVAACEVGEMNCLRFIWYVSTGQEDWNMEQYEY
jgi:hypothetical protein